MKSKRTIWVMEKKVLMMICLATLAVLAVNPTSMATEVYIDDGLPHIFDDSTYQHDDVYLDYYTANIPGTHVDLVDDGLVFELWMYNNSTATILGGEIGWFVWAYNNSTFTMNSGLVGIDVISFDNSTVNMSGGYVGNRLLGRGDSAITMSGGSVEWLNVAVNAVITITGGQVRSELRTYDSGTIYLDGTGFEVDGNPLEYGDRLSNFGTWNGTYYTGTITGTLAEGATLNNTFRIHNMSDIIIVPEPTTLVLLALGALMLRGKR